MSYQVLARKWRPKRFEDVVGQDHVTRSLQNSLRTGKLAHAYLFTGTRGVGKTSIARLFAKAIRCENRSADFNPCGQCLSCKDIDQGNSLDYIEIDGASNNSVDNIRELIENVRYLPARGTFKIYVIDEVHMLSNAAFNALLKTLEEPPAHVLFIFATTDSHKLLGTVISRCQRFDFKNVTNDVLARHAQMVAEAEGIKFSDAQLVGKLAEYGRGSVRDMLSLFDQVLSLAGGKVITDEIFFQSLGLARTGALSDLLGAVLCEKPLEASRVFQSLLNENIDLKRLIDQLLDTFYVIIQKIDAPAEIYTTQVLPVNALEGISYGELFWIYETFSKDCQWALLGPSPEKTVDLVLQKIARRRQILKPDASLIQKPGVSISVPAAALEKKKKVVSERIADLIDSIHSAPTIRASLEMSDFLEAPKFVGDELHLTFAFHANEGMNTNYLKDADVAPKFRALLANFYQVPEAKIHLQLTELSVDEVRVRNFSTHGDREQKRHQQEIDDRKNKILNDPFVKEAERLFNARVDKVILKDTKQ